MNDYKGENKTLAGVVEDVVYYNSENGYAVCHVDTGDDLVAVVGYLPYVAVGESVTVTGAWVTHAEYGEQFKAEFYEKNMPKAAAEIQGYLASGVIKGVREATAKKIVEHFGERSLDVIASAPERLAEINGISKAKAMEIGQSYALQIGVRDTVIFLQKYGISPGLAVRVYKHYGSGAAELVRENPYLLSREVYGIGFKTADKIALGMGFSPNAPQRISAGADFVLWEAAMGGNTYLPREVLVERTCRLTGADTVECDAAVTTMLFENRLMNELLPQGEALYHPALHHAETAAALRLSRIASVGFVQTDVDMERVMAQAERERGITLAPRQKEAVRAAMRHGALVITGGPGTGKTTIINAIIRVMERLGKTVLLAAPTGRAAKRMSELCQMEAKTLHRLLEVGFSEEDDGMRFSRDEDNPLPCDCLIVDEMSMVDTLLLHALLKSVKTGTRLIMVGDSDQLPSVGAGDVLRGVIASGVVPVVRLTDIFRQAKESMIVVNAHRINRGEEPVFNRKDGDFFLMHRQGGQELVNTIVDLCTTRLPATYGYDPLRSIQVLTPTRKGVAGVAALNERLQQALNPPERGKREKALKGMVFREGDKVMQVKNNYELAWEKDGGAQTGTGVFNGDLGRIEAIRHQEEKVDVVFDDDRRASYDYGRLEELELAYAVTVHKSQGSEFDAVVIPMYPAPPMLQNRNLLYTAVTRAKKLVVLVGRQDVVRTMVENVSEHRRFCGLERKLREIR